jgi:hypothetical protein
MTLNDINKLGAKTYFEDRGVYRNPYPAGTPEFNEFERGWMQSLKKDEGRLVSESERQARKLERKPQTTYNAGDFNAERYRSRKG